MIYYDTFDKLGMDFVGPISLLSNQNSYILVCIDYLTKWEKVKSLREANEMLVAKFMNERIFLGYAVPREIVTN